MPSKRIRARSPDINQGLDSPGIDVEEGASGRGAEFSRRDDMPMAGTTEDIAAGGWVSFIEYRKIVARLEKRIAELEHRKEQS